VLHLALALYIIAFSLGIAALILTLMAQIRYQEISFLFLALLLTGTLLILGVDILKLYGRLTSTNLILVQPVVDATISAVGFGIIAYIIPLLGCRLIGHPVTPPLIVLWVCIGAASAVLGALREIMPGDVTMIAATIGVSGLQIYAICIVLPHQKRITNQPLRILARSFAWLFIAGMAATCAETGLRFLPNMPSIFREISIVQILYCLIAGALLLAYAFRYLFIMEHNSTVTLPDPFVMQFGISPRERQIISMMIHGYSNQRIGEELFISSITVKNHIYHIYQKTGVKNKVQLINLINPPK